MSPHGASGLAGAGEPGGSPRSRYLEGARSMLVFLPSVVPMALAGGALGPTSGLSPAQTLGLAMAANSGTAQFVAFSLAAQGASILTIAMTTLVLGLRMLVYATVLREHLTDVPRGWRVVLAFGLIDAIFFVVVDRLRNGSLNTNKHWFFFGASNVMYGVWMVCTAIGAGLGSFVPNPQDAGLDFPMTAVFVAMLALSLSNRKLGAVAAASGVTVLLFRDVPYNLGILVAVAAGVSAGMAWDAWKAPGGQSTAPAETPGGPTTASAEAPGGAAVPTGTDPDRREP